MSAAHTPGPWTMQTVVTSCGLCHKIGPFPAKLSDPGRLRHACVYDDYPGPGEGTPELVANARLIAAAPELLEIVGRLMHVVEAGIPDLEDVDCYQMAKELLAKIDGGAA